MGWGPSAPDMSGANEAARSGAAISTEQWEYYQKEIAPRALQQMDDQIQIGRDTYDMAKEGQDFQMGLTRKYDDRYWGTQVPLEDSMIADARGFDSGAWADQQMGRARADVGKEFDDMGRQMSRTDAARGVNLSSGAAAQRQTSIAMEKAKALTSASGKINLAADQLGWSRKGEVAALGRGLPGFTSNASTAAANWGQSGVAAGASGMAGISSASGMNVATGGSAAQGLQSASSSMRANAIEEAKTPLFDAAMGLAAGGMKMYGSMR